MQHALSPTDDILSAYAQFSILDRPLSAVELGQLVPDLGPMCSELKVMRTCDPRPSARQSAPGRVGDFVVDFWATCFATNPDYRFTDRDARALALVVPSVAKELLAYRKAILKDHYSFATEIKKAMAARVRGRPKPFFAAGVA